MTERNFLKKSLSTASKWWKSLDQTQTSVPSLSAEECAGITTSEDIHYDYIMWVKKKIQIFEINEKKMFFVENFFYFCLFLFKTAASARNGASADFNRFKLVESVRIKLGELVVLARPDAQNIFAASQIRLYGFPVTATTIAIAITISYCRGQSLRNIVTFNIGRPWKSKEHEDVADDSREATSFAAKGS